MKGKKASVLFSLKTVFLSGGGPFAMAIYLVSHALSLCRVTHTNRLLTSAAYHHAFRS